MMGITQRLTTNVPGLDQLGRAPKNQFAHATALPDASYVDVQLPNVNSLYSLAYLDLSTEPVILHIPDMGSRFFLIKRLTAAERCVLELIAKGKTSSEIAEDLHVSIRTVEHHRAHISEKLNLHGSNALLRFAIAHRSELS